MNALHIKLNKEHSAFQWLETQADKIGAKGHIGTHLDCYTCIPQEPEYQVATYCIDCSKEMPSPGVCQSLPDLKHKALVLYTGNMEQNGYGNNTYFEKNTSLTEETLKAILRHEPAFIIIDSHGIGSQGKVHIELDKLCESHGCHVIENANITSATKDKIQKIKILIDIANPSTGKPCKLYY